MLKITVSHDQQGTTFVLAGRLAGPWVEELRRSWRAEMDAKGDRRGLCRVDLRETTYIDAEGQALMSEMHGKGVTFLTWGCMTRAIVENLNKSCTVPQSDSAAGSEDAQHH